MNNVAKIIANALRIILIMWLLTILMVAAIALGLNPAIYTIGAISVVWAIYAIFA